MQHVDMDVNELGVGKGKGKGKNKGKGKGNGTSDRFKLKEVQSWTGKKAIFCRFHLVLFSKFQIIYFTIHFVKMKMYSLVILLELQARASHFPN